jgi:hypothetical protein
MKHQEISGEKGVFSFNPMQAINWLLQNRNALLVFSSITIRNHFPRYKGEDLENDEQLFCLREVRCKPAMTPSQVKTAFENLCHYGFIELLEFNPKYKRPGLKKIRVLNNPFEEDACLQAQEFVNTHGGGGLY